MLSPKDINELVDAETIILLVKCISIASGIIILAYLFAQENEKPPELTPPFPPPDSDQSDFLNNNSLNLASTHNGHPSVGADGIAAATEKGAPETYPLVDLYNTVYTFFFVTNPNLLYYIAGGVSSVILFLLALFYLTTPAMYPAFFVKFFNRSYWHEEFHYGNRVTGFPHAAYVQRMNQVKRAVLVQNAAKLGPEALEELYKDPKFIQLSHSLGVKPRGPAPFPR